MASRKESGTSAAPRPGVVCPSNNELRTSVALARRRDRGGSLVSIVEFDAARVPDVPAFLWKWRNVSRFEDVPQHGEPGVCYYVAEEQLAYLWAGELQVMSVDVRPPADVIRKAFGSWIVGVDFASAESRTVAALVRDGQVIEIGSFAELYGMNVDEEDEMFGEDPLEHDERLRLEALSQAIAWASAKSTRPAEEVVKIADTFREYIENGIPEKDEDEEEVSE